MFFQTFLSISIDYNVFYLLSFTFAQKLNAFNNFHYSQRNDQNDENSGKPVLGPHMVFHYRDKTILDDAANLLIHHVKRQTGIQKGEKRRIKHILRQFIPDLFFHPRQQLSDDEREDDGESVAKDKHLDVMILMNFLCFEKH